MRKTTLTIGALLTCAAVLLLCQQASAKRQAPTLAAEEQATIASLQQITQSEDWEGTPCYAPPSADDPNLRIAYAMSTGDMGQIMLATAAGGGSRRVLTISAGLSRDLFPSFSPDGRQMVFQSSRLTNVFNIWRVNVDGSGLTQLTSNPLGAYLPEWSPSRKWIAFVARDKDAKKPTIWIMTPDGDKLTALHSGQDPTWSPDGRFLAFCDTDGKGQRDLWSMDMEGGSLTRITDTDKFDEYSPSWSPDGRAIAYVRAGGRRDIDRKLWQGGGSAQIWMREMSEDGSWSRAATQITFTRGLNDFPAWSPDGTMIAFQSDRGGNHDIWVARLKSRVNIGSPIAPMQPADKKEEEQPPWK